MEQLGTCRQREACNFYHNTPHPNDPSCVDWQPLPAPAEPVAGEAEPEESRQLAAYRKKYGALRGTELSDIEQAGLSLELVELLEERCRNLEEDNEHLKNLLRCDPSDRIDDGFGNTWSRTCSTCGLGTMHINRPGEVQCDYCA